MKRTILVFILGLCILKSFGCEKDSIFEIRLQHDSLNYKLNIVFKNISNDTVWLQKHFKDYFMELRYTPGFRISFSRNNQQFMPNWGELPKQNYEIDNGRKVGKYNISIFPQEEAILTVKLPFGLFIKSKAEKENKKSDNLCIVLELYYRYFIPKKKKMELKYFKSDSFELKY